MPSETRLSNARSCPQSRDCVDCVRPESDTFVIRSLIVAVHALRQDSISEVPMLTSRKYRRDYEPIGYEFVRNCDTYAIAAHFAAEALPHYPSICQTVNGRRGKGTMPAVHIK